MAAVAPIGVEKSDRPEFFSGLCGGAKICQRVVMFADERLPGRSAGTNVEWNFCLGESGGFFFKWMIRLVTPIQCNQGRDVLPCVLADRQVGPAIFCQF